MSLLALLAIGALGALGSWRLLARGGTAARGGAVVGVGALVVMILLGATLTAADPATADETGIIPGTLWNGALAATAYLRLVVVLWAGCGVVLAGITALVRGVAGLRPILPATLAGLVGTAVALAATTPAIEVVAAGAVGLASVPVVLATGRLASVGVAAREVRIALATTAVVLAVAAVAPVLSRLVLANPDGPAAAPGSGAAVAVAFGTLAMALVIAARMGSIPYHVRVSALTDAAPVGSLPLVTAWLPLPLGVAAVGVASGVLAPLALPIGAAQSAVVAVALLMTLAAALVAYLQDDLRHAVGYLTVADLGFVGIAFAALDPEAWGPARAWLLIAAVTKTALGAWAMVVEARFETRSVPDLRGWIRPAPVLGVGLVVVVLATYGLPGWSVMHARLSLATLAAGAPWDALLIGASLLTLPAYARWLVLGIGRPTSHVDRVRPEYAGLRLGSLPARRVGVPGSLRRGRASSATLQVEQEESPAQASPAPASETGPGAVAGASPAVESETAPAGSGATADATPQGGAPETPAATLGLRSRGMATATRPEIASSAPEATGDAGAAEAAASPADRVAARAGRRGRTARPLGTAAADAIRRHRAGLLSSAVLVLALLASLVASGALDVAPASGEPAPGGDLVTTIED